MSSTADLGNGVHAIRVVNPDDTNISGGSGGAAFDDGEVPATVQGTPTAFNDVGTIRVVSAANPLPVDLTGGEVGITAGEEHLGSVGGSTVSLYIVPTITAGAYSAGDVVGGEITLTNAMRVSSGTGMLMSLTIVDAGNQKAPLDIFIFDSDPSNGQADNAAYAWNAADFARLLAHIPISAADYTTIADEAVCTILTGGIPVQANGSTSLFAILVTSGTPTYTANTDLRLRFGLSRD